MHGFNLKHLKYGKVLSSGVDYGRTVNVRSIEYENLMKITDYYSIYVYNYDSWKVWWNSVNGFYVWRDIISIFICIFILFLHNILDFDVAEIYVNIFAC